jgi:ubiquinone/menaquinone biosynthesis C-methylase UbiE
MTDGEAERHKRWVAGVFDRAAATYDRVGDAYHDEFGRQLVRLVDIAEGADLLDVACGRGAVLVPASERVGADGRVVGVDLSSAMLDRARAAVVDAGVDAELLVMDAERLDFADDSFDVVLCAFALPFFPHPEAAVAEFARVVRPGGTVGLVTWADDDADWAWQDELLASVQVERRAVARGFDRAEEVVAVLADAGLGSVAVSRLESYTELADADAWWRLLWSCSLRGLLEQLDPARVEALRRAALPHLHRMERAGPLRMRLAANVVLGRRHVGQTPNPLPTS